MSPSVMCDPPSYADTAVDATEVLNCACSKGEMGDDCWWWSWSSSWWWWGGVDGTCSASFVFVLRDEARRTRDCNGDLGNEEGEGVLRLSIRLTQDQNQQIRICQQRPGATAEATTTVGRPARGRRGGRGGQSCGLVVRGVEATAATASSAVCGGRDGERLVACQEHRPRPMSDALSRPSVSANSLVGRCVLCRRRPNALWYWEGEAMRRRRLSGRALQQNVLPHARARREPSRSTSP